MTGADDIVEASGPAVLALMQSVGALISNAMASGMDPCVVIAIVAACAADYVRVMGGNLEALCETVRMRANEPLPRHTLTTVAPQHGNA